MKLFFALVVASLCVAAYSSPVELDDVDERGIWDSTVNAAKKLKAKLQEALAVAKGQLGEFAKVLGEQKDVALAKVNQLEDQLITEAKQKAKEALDQALDQAKQQAAALAKAEIDRLIGELDGIKQKVEGLKQ